jgi:hypothetical protein
MYGVSIKDCESVCQRPKKDLEDCDIVGAVIELFEMIGAHIAF